MREGHTVFDGYKGLRSACSVQRKNPLTGFVKSIDMKTELPIRSTAPYSLSERLSACAGCFFFSSFSNNIKQMSESVGYGPEF